MPTKGEVILTKAMMSAACRELNASGLLEREISGADYLIVREMICKALTAGGVFYKIREGA